MSKFIKKYGTLFGLIILCAFFSFASPTFHTLGNVFTVLRQISMLTILSCGLTFVMITGHADLSIGYSSSFLGIVCGILIVDMGLPVWLGILGTILAGVIIGAINGFSVAYLGVPDFIGTLGIGYLISGLNQSYTRGHPITGFPDSFNLLGAARFFHLIPSAFLVMLVVFIIFSVIIKYTRFGRHLYAIGDNREATMMSGINVKFNIMMAFVVCGIGAAIMSIVMTSRLGAANPLAGESYMLEAMAAVYLGSTVFKNGEPNLPGTVVGALIMGIISNGLTLMDVAYYYQLISTGVIILAAVVVTSVQRMKKK